jgi:hypothetical protein
LRTGRFYLGFTAVYPAPRRFRPAERHRIERTKHNFDYRDLDFLEKRQDVREDQTGRRGDGTDLWPLENIVGLLNQELKMTA